MVTPSKPSAAAPKEKSPFPACFRSGDTPRVQRLAFWLLVWNCMALADALAFTFTPEANLDTYHGPGTYNQVTLAQVRMLANCQLGLISMIALVALTGDELMIRRTFRLLILITLGAFRGVYLGMAEGSILPIWESAWASLLSIPPFLFLAYFGFVY